MTGRPAWWNATFPDETPAPAATLRSVTSLALSRLVELSGATEHEFAERLRLLVGAPVNVDLLRAWCDPAGPCPPAHWLVGAALLVGPAAGSVLRELVG